MVQLKEDDEEDEDEKPRYFRKGRQVLQIQMKRKLGKTVARCDKDVGNQCIENYWPERQEAAKKKKKRFEISQGKSKNG